jgi:hypothetical protein
VLVSDVIAYARFVTNHDTDTQSTDAQLIPVVNAIYQETRRKLAMIVPTLYTAVSASFTISSGNTQDVTAAPLSLTDFERVRLLQRQVNTSDWRPVGVANPIDPERLPVGEDFAFLERGNFLELYPSLSAPGQTFRLRYLQKPAAVTTVGGATGTLLLPDGADEYMGEMLASKMRQREKEDVKPHLDAAERALRELKWDLSNRYGSTPGGLAEGGAR